MSGIIERVAEAIFGAIPVQDGVKARHGILRFYSWEEYKAECPRFADQVRDQARAALAAMREPTAAMTMKVPTYIVDDGDGVIITEHDMRSVWHEMIDEALQE